MQPDVPSMPMAKPNTPTAKLNALLDRLEQEGPSLNALLAAARQRQPAIDAVLLEAWQGHSELRKLLARVTPPAADNAPHDTDHRNHTGGMPEKEREQ